MTKPEQQPRGSLQQQADLVCRALDGAPHGFAVVSVDGRVVAANGTLKRWAGEEQGEPNSSAVGGAALRGFRLSQRGDVLAAVARAAQGEAETQSDAEASAPTQEQPSEAPAIESASSDSSALEDSKEKNP